MNLIICEDDRRFRENINKVVNREIIINDYNVKISLVTDKEEEILNYVKNHLYDENIYFLDIELNTKNEGIDLAKKIREYDKRGYIVFITSHEELAILTYKYKLAAFDYIVKSTFENLKKDIGQVLKNILSEENEVNEEKYLRIDNGSNVIKIKYEEILFIETIGNHRIRINGLNDIFEFYGSLKDLEEKLPSYYIRIHKSYIVNQNNIKRINKRLHEIEMINGSVCYYSRSYYGELRKYVGNII